ncbi:apolipoprotein N-acyltransferase [Deinococcus lacus]|uniref:Apolipoprotein N-acyltransferase n=1 Tax=Deinococcus lacus TaxID=392561 RepID=A0ABW1YCM7_9DEIO
MLARFSLPVAAALGLGLGLTLLSSAGWLALPLVAAALLHATTAPGPRALVARLFWTGTFYSAGTLWWVMILAGKALAFPPAGLLAWVLYAIQGAFLAAAGLIVSRVSTSPLSRIWWLAAAWLLLEWLRFLGPLAFPWPTLGAALLNTPLIQLADLGGVLLVSAVMLGSAAALASWRWNRQPLLWLVPVLALCLGYGLTRQPQSGPVQHALLVRTDFDGFERASGQLDLPATLRRLSTERRPEELLIWPESSLHPSRLAEFPAPGLLGLVRSPLAGDPAAENVVAAAADGLVVAENPKAKPVPFGESFPTFGGLLTPLYRSLEARTGFDLTHSVAPAAALQPLPLGGVLYGAYVCYDSIFGWPARQLAAQGAQVLVNVSNDSWFVSAGVRQHFELGRIRAIETRRYLLRSVHAGWAGTINDLGQPTQLLTSGEGAIHAEYRLLSGQTLYTRVGDLPALGVAAFFAAYGAWLGRRSRPQSV